MVVAALTAIVVVCTMGAADVGKALTAKGRAQAAADAAALAADQELALPSGRSPADVAAEYVGQRYGTYRMPVRTRQGARPRRHPGRASLRSGYPGNLDVSTSIFSMDGGCEKRSSACSINAAAT